MRVLFLDCFAGISGNMLAGAFLDAGMPLEHLQAELAKLPLAGEYELICRSVTKLGIGSTYFNVALTSKAHDQNHNHEHGHCHDHKHDHGQDHDHEHKHEHAAHRGLTDIRKILAESSLSDFVKAKAEAIFYKLAQAESQVHQCDIETIHFHEVGAVDAIIDIVSAAIGLEYFKIEKVWSTPVNTGRGMVFCAHGLMPIPAPATARLLTGIPVFQRDDIEKELTTPTGAAILATLEPSFEMPPVMISRAIGYGAGTWDLPIPNTLRMTVADVAVDKLDETLFQGASEATLTTTKPETWQRERVLQIETNIDDMQPEWYDLLMERLFLAGALDVYLTPIYMKKNRPAQQLTCLAPLTKEAEILQLVFENSTALGLRITYPERAILRRSWQTVSTNWGQVRIKLGWAGERIINQAPEYEDCLLLAKQSGVSVQEVYLAALAKMESPLTQTGQEEERS